MLNTLVLRLTHTGLNKDGNPQKSSVYIPDLDVGYEYQPRKSKVYVPYLGSVLIPISSQVSFSMYFGSIKKFVADGLLTADTLVDTGSGTFSFGPDRIEYVANVPGLFLPGVACLSAPNGSFPIIMDPTKCLGSAQILPTSLSVDFRVEKTSASSPSAVGSGIKLFDLRFSTVNRAGAAVNVNAANLTIETGEMIRIVNPIAADTTLADVSISLIGFPK